MDCVLVFLATALLKLPSVKKAQEFIKVLESNHLLVANRYSSLVSCRLIFLKVLLMSICFYLSLVRVETAVGLSSLSFIT